MFIEISADKFLNINSISCIEKTPQNIYQVCVPYIAENGAEVDTYIVIDSEQYAAILSELDRNEKLIRKN